MAQHIYLLVTIVMMICLVTATQADDETHCTDTCKRCIDVSESFKRVQCKTTCLAFLGASPFNCSNVNPVPPAVLKTELMAFTKKFYGHIAANEEEQIRNMMQADSYMCVPVSTNPIFGLKNAIKFFKDWRSLNAVDEQSESVDIINCGENDGYVWWHGIGYGYSQPNQQGNKVESHRAQSLLKREADNSLKVYLDVFH